MKRQDELWCADPVPLTHLLHADDQNEDWILDRGYLPHAVIRAGIRQQLRARLSALDAQQPSLADGMRNKMDYIAKARQLPIAVATDTANEQHYEVSTGFLAACLGPRLKYSCCRYRETTTTLAQAEIDMLDEYMEKAELRDGMTILDLGCGWGSASLYFAEKLPLAKIVAFSNSRTQKEHIDSEAARKGLENLSVRTGDIVDYEFASGEFDRVVTIELFEHMKNYERLMEKLATALKPGGKLFVHIFAHRDTPYDFEDGWMATHFFTGGTMPSADLLLYFQRDLTLQKQWWVNGMNYSRTCEDWLSAMTTNKKRVWPHLVETYGETDAATWYNRWQIFYMACSELFAYSGGDVWGVSHYLFEKAKA